MGIAALVVRLVARGRARQVLLLALAGSLPGPDDLPPEAVLTPDMAETVELVDVANSAFPRGPEFAEQVDRPGFRAAWDSLDAATTALEERIAEKQRLGVGVAYRAVDTARDARSRLNTLRRIAADEGQAWADLISSSGAARRGGSPSRTTEAPSTMVTAAPRVTA